MLGGNTSIADPGANFKNAFAGTTNGANGLVNALVRITFSYQGFQNCFNVMNEIKVCSVVQLSTCGSSLTYVFRPGSGKDDQKICSNLFAPSGGTVHAL